MASLDGENWSYWNTTSHGQAKMMFLRNLDFDHVKFTDVKCRVVGVPHTSADFVRNAKYRKIPFAYCGMKVKVGDDNGFIVGHNSSANLDVLFVDGKYKGQTLNCHPYSQITYFNPDGSIAELDLSEIDLSDN